MGIFENKGMEFIFVLSIQIPLLAKYKIIWYRVLSMRKTKHRLGLVSSSASLFIAVAYLFFFFYGASTKIDIGDQDCSHTEIIWSQESSSYFPLLVGRF